MKMNFRRIIAAAAALAMCTALTACGGNGGEQTESTSAAEESTSESTEAPASEAQVDISEVFGDSSATLASTTDVENEVDRAIYKAQVALPDGWQLLQDTNEGKLYGSALGTLTVQAQNYGEDADLQELATFADGVAATIKMNNMFYQADTDFGDPQETTVAGLPAIRYDYTVTAYIYDVDDEGNTISDSKHVYGEFSDRMYALYNGTDAYILMFETTKDNAADAESDFDKLVEGFTISEDGTAGYEAASEFMASQSEAAASAAEAASEQAASETSESTDGE